MIAVGKPIIHAREVTKSFGPLAVLKGVNCDVMPSEVSVVIGPSGSGKSTLLRCCNGLEIADGGTIDICGQRLVDNGVMLPEAMLNALRMNVGMVFQSFNLFPHLSVLGNVTIGPRKLRGRSVGAADAEARQILDKVGLG
ncbi:MAG TPA: ATP-binding cassette domain-containing protein, partial [Casimicrobiaceae bacterium]